MEIIIALAVIGLLAYAWYVNQKPSKPVDLVQPNPVADVAEKNIKETTEAVIAKIEVTQEPVAEPAPEVKETPWIEKQPAPIAKTNKPRQQSAKAVPAPKKKKPAAKS